MKTRDGYLYKRGTVWYAAYYLNSKRIAKSAGKTKKREADRELERMMEPVTARSEVAMLENIAGRLAARKAKIAEIDDKQNPPLKFSDAWDSFLSSSYRPRRAGKATLSQYEGHWKRFARWITGSIPEVEYLRDISPEIADTYATDLHTAGLSPNRFNKHINFLNLLFRVLKKPAESSPRQPKNRQSSKSGFILYDTHGSRCTPARSHCQYSPA